MKHRSLVLVVVLLAAFLAPGFPGRLALAGVQSEEAQEEPAPEDEGMEEEEPIDDEPEEELQEEPAEQAPEGEEAPSPAPQQAPPVQAPAQQPLLTPPPPPAAQPPVVPPAGAPPTSQPTQVVPPPKSAPAPATAPPTTAAPSVPASAAPVPPPAATTPAPATPTAPAAPAVKLSSSQLKARQRLVAGPLGEDPTAVALMSAIGSETATARDFNDLGVYLARKNYLPDAELFAETAVKLDKTNRDYWLNYGTIRLQVGTLSSALTAYKKARDLDPNFGFSWYSMGVVYDYMRNYDKAVEAYTMALNLDPSLGDATKNPQAVNNERLLVVNLLLYREKEGGLVMPLRGGPPVEEPVTAETGSKKGP